MNQYSYRRSTGYIDITNDFLAVILDILLIQTLHSKFKFITRTNLQFTPTNCD